MMEASSLNTIGRRADISINNYINAKIVDYAMLYASCD